MKHKRKSICLRGRNSLLKLKLTQCKQTSRPKSELRTIRPVISVAPKYAAKTKFQFQFARQIIVERVKNSSLQKEKLFKICEKSKVSNKIE